MARRIVAPGDVFGRWTIIEMLGGSGKQQKRKVRCCCQCGTEAIRHEYSLAAGLSQSCGCLWRERIRGHGQATQRTPEYAAWADMLSRCRNPKTRNYSRYGGRGITVCAQWNAFDRFFADMGSRPSAHHSLDRKNNDGPYSPENCRWATRVEQMRNTRLNKWIAAFGQTKTAAEWCVLYAIRHETLRGRLERGWDAERALTEHLHPGRHTGDGRRRRIRRVVPGAG